MPSRWCLKKDFWDALEKEQVCRINSKRTSATCGLEPFSILQGCHGKRRLHKNRNVHWATAEDGAGSTGVGGRSNGWPVAFPTLEPNSQTFATPFPKGPAGRIVFSKPTQIYFRRADTSGSSPKSLASTGRSDLKKIDDDEKPSTNAALTSCKWSPDSPGGVRVQTEGSPADDQALMIHGRATHVNAASSMEPSPVSACYPRGQLSSRLGRALRRACEYRIFSWEQGRGERPLVLLRLHTFSHRSIDSIGNTKQVVTGLHPGIAANSMTVATVENLTGHLTPPSFLPTGASLFARAMETKQARSDQSPPLKSLFYQPSTKNWRHWSTCSCRNLEHGGGAP